MAEEKGIGEGETKDTSTAVAAAITSDGKGNKKRKGILSRVWNGIFRLHGDDFEKRLKYISKEEASIVARMKRRSYTWRRMTRNLIAFSVIFEVLFCFFTMLALVLICNFGLVLLVQFLLLCIIYCNLGLCMSETSKCVRKNSGLIFCCYW